MYYSYAGEFINELKHPTRAREFAIEQGYIYTYEDDFDGNVNISAFNEKMDLIKVAQLDSGRTIKKKEFGTKHSFIRGNFMSQNKAVYITRQFDNSIYAMRPKGLYREYNIDFTEHTLPIHMLEREMTSGEFSSECYSKKYICGISDVVENDNYLFFNTNIGHCIYDKKKEELTGYGTLYNRKLGVSNNNLMTTGCSNKITMILDPHMLKAQFNIRSKSDKNWAIKDPDNYKWYELIDEESNPVLLIYEF